jgi:WD40 repeat protein
MYVCLYIYEYLYLHMYIYVYIGCDVLAVAFRPDGKEICAAATNGNLHIWDVEEGIQVGLMMKMFT